MEYLAFALSGLCGLSLLALLAGLVKPSLVVRWGTVRTRARAALIWGGATAVFLILALAVVRFTPKSAGGPGDTETPGPKQPSVFSQLEITGVTAEEGAVRITGKTDLPSGALLVIDFDVADPEPESETAVSERTTVTGGTFSVTVEAPDTPAFDEGPYTVTVLFSPRAQPDGVLSLVGANGENLAGPLAQDTFGFRVLETTRKVDLDLRPTET